MSGLDLQCDLCGCQVGGKGVGGGVQLGGQADEGSWLQITRGNQTVETGASLGGRLGLQQRGKVLDCCGHLAK